MLMNAILGLEIGLETQQGPEIGEKLCENMTKPDTSFPFYDPLPSVNVHLPIYPSISENKH